MLLQPVKRNNSYGQAHSIPVVVSLKVIVFWVQCLTVLTVLHLGVNLDCCNSGLMIAWIGCICVCVIGFMSGVCSWSPEFFFLLVSLVDFPLFDVPRQAFHLDFGKNCLVFAVPS